MPLTRSIERIGITTITFMLTSILGIACGSIGVYRLPTSGPLTGSLEQVASPAVAPSPLLETSRIDAGHRHGTVNEQSFFISGLPRAAEPFAKVVAMDTLGHMAITTAAGDGSFMITSVPRGFEVAPGSKLLLSQIAPRLGESAHSPVRIAGL